MSLSQRIFQEKRRLIYPLVVVLIVNVLIFAAVNLGSLVIVRVEAARSELGVKLVVDFRAAYAGLGCAPALPPPPPLLLRLAAQYRVPVRH